MDNENFTVDFGEVTNVGGGGTSDFNELTNRPKYDSNTMSGDTNIPKVPSKTSDLTNDSDYQTETEVSDAISTAIGAISIPTKTSDLTNDGADGQSTYVETDELATVATSGSYNDLDDKPSIPTYSDFTGTDGTSAGAAGLVPAPTTADVDKFLKSDGTWEATGGGGDTVYSTRTTSDGSTGGAVYIGNLDSSQVEQPDPTATDYHFKYFWALPYSNSSTPGDRSINILGSNAGANWSIALGNESSVITGKDRGIAIGQSAIVKGSGSVALGAQTYIDTGIDNAVAIGRSSMPTRSGEVNIGAGTTGYGYNSTNYRLLGGVHDPIAAHDAATKGYVDAHSGGGGGIKFLSASDFNYDDGNTGSFNTVAMWLLDDGFYFMPSDYTAIPVKGGLNGTNVGRFNADISAATFYCFIKANNCFWMFCNSSSQDPTIYANRPIFFCTINPANGWFSTEAGDQLAKRSELTA